MPDEKPPRPESEDALAAYRAKRSADRSPEPVGVPGTVPGHLFVVHKHAARQLHFDLRLEMDGVLRSWAVPRGPSYDQADKRLAVKVEDHPLEYADFEGVIPEGNYGAGGVIVWDRGEWVPLEDWREGLEKGKLLFELKGYKLKGKWTLVKIKKTEKEWLFIKERDAYLKSPGDQFPEESVLSGLTVEEVKTGRNDASVLRREVEGAAKPGRVSLDTAHVMLAEAREGAFTRDGWIFELKMDGYRMLAAKEKGEVRLVTRNGNDYTRVFPEITKAVRALPFEQFVIDGEIVVNDGQGRPSFALLQKRGSLSNETDIRRMAVELPTTFYVFDLLGFEQMDLRDLTLVRRKGFLERALPPVGAVRYLEHIETQGEAMLAHVGKMGLEGIIAKKADAPYRAGRTSQWYKIKSQHSGDFVVVGFTAPQGNRTGFGALQIGDYVDGKLVYAGRAGTGFTEKQLQEIHDMLLPDVRAEPACFGPVKARGQEPLPSESIPETGSTTWVEPRHVCEVRYTEWTPDGVLRHPAFLRLRDDKRPHECERQDWRNVDSGTPAPTTPHTPSTPQAPEANASDLPRVVQKTVNISNPKKIFWPAENYTKGDMIEYYRGIAPWLLPYLKDRPVVLTRFPDGIDGKSFYQKDAPDFAPEWMRTVPIWSNDTNRFIQYFVCDDIDGLTYLANSGTIPLHIWMSRVETLERPDWCVIDLDPKEAPFSDVVKTALVLHRICGEIGLPDYIKTTGKTGLHIMIPLGRQLTYEQCRTLGELLARLVIRELGDITTITRHVTRRGDKVYLDYLQNRHGQLIVSPYSVRPLPGATVSMPISWDEVHQELDPRAFTIKTAIDRMTTLGEDPVRPVIDEKADLAAVMTRLATIMAG